MARQSNRPSGTVIKGLRIFLHTYADGACVVCGQATRLDGSPSDGDRAEVGHLLSDALGGGYTGGNLANMCRACNSAAGDRDLLALVPMFAHADGIPASIPGPTALINMGRTGDDKINSERASVRASLGLPF